MHFKSKFFLFFVLIILSTNVVLSQSDSSKTSLKLYSSSFFDNKEFTGNIKKGYTIPGIFIQPTLNIRTDKFSVDAGLHMIYVAGTDSLEKLVPVLNLSYNVSPNFTMVVGTINSKQNHNLPEPLFKPERYYLNQPELGVQFLVNKSKFNGDLWINWERYIKNGSPFQEEFMVGLVTNYKPSTFENRQGFYAITNALAMHKGGQIDSTNLPVTTIVNAGVTVGHKFFLADSDLMMGFELSGYVSADKSPQPHTKFKNGNALYPKLLILWTSTTFELGYWYAKKFVNPRGEELFGSLSTIDPSFDEPNRKIITSKLMFQKDVNNQLSVATGLNIYYDINNELTEYSYFFRITFDGTVFSKP
jgi:hypothetical protein